MYCPKCGIENPDNNVFCRSCGARVQGEVSNVDGSGAGSVSSSSLQVIPAGAVIVAASSLVILGTFLPWTTDYHGLGLNMFGGNGGVICLLAVLSIAALVLSRSGATGAWHVVMSLLSLTALALTLQYLYWRTDTGVSISYGFWLTLAGVLGLTAGTTLEFLRSTWK